MTTLRSGTLFCVFCSSLAVTLLRLFEIAVVWLGITAVATAANGSWIGGNADWNSSSANWSGNDEPDADDVAIFNTANSVDLINASESVSGLTMRRRDQWSRPVDHSSRIRIGGALERFRR